MGIRLVVLDRDGVINCDSDSFIRSADEWLAIEGSVEGIALLSKHGFTVAVASNQSGLARGHFDLTALEGIHRKMCAEVKAAGGRIDRIVFCPHGPDEGCDCRKPAPGLLRQLGEHYGIDMTGVPFVGDAERDLDAARAIGARPVLVRTGKGGMTEAAVGEGVEVYDDLLNVARALVAEYDQ
jgi:D-glycero-D-manno-heptose 1,7-bisphosphate phosphatase